MHKANRGLICTIAAAVMLMAGATPAAQAPQQDAQANCSEWCLSKILDSYLAGLLAKNPRAVPLASDVRFSENNVMLQPGEGLWGTINLLDRTRETRWFDPQSGEIGYLGVVAEHGLGAYLAARLKVRDGRIVELETMVNRKEPGPRIETDLYRPDPYFAEVLPLDQRTPRARMIKLVDGYFSTLQLNDGKIFTEFAGDCRRGENGMITAGAPTHDRPKLTGCAHQLKLGELRRITGARERAYFAVDETRGMVFSRVFLDHDGVLAEYRRTDGTMMSAAPHLVPQTWCVLEAFKVVARKISRIQAVMIGCPYKLPTPWAGLSAR